MTTFLEISKKPSKLVLENNIGEDILLPTDTIGKLITKVVEVNNPRPLDFLFVYADVSEKDGKKLYTAKAVVTHKEFGQLVSLLLQQIDNRNNLLSSLRLETLFPIKYQVKDTDPISEVIKILNSGATDTILVQDEDGYYIGKIKRTKFSETIKLLVS